jgi:hypothetical protein
MGSCSWRRRRGTRGGQRWRVMMAGGGSSPNWAVGGGGLTSGDVGVPLAVGRGQEARGTKWCSWHACEGGREGGGGERGGRHR